MNGRKQINTAGGSPAASYLSCLAKKGNPKKSPPVCRRFAVPCVARPVRLLRNSHCVLRQSSQKPPDLPALLGGAQGKRSKAVLCGVRARFFLVWVCPPWWAGAPPPILGFCFF